MQNHPSSPLTSTLPAFILSVAFTSLASGQVVARFESGSGTTTSDQFVGTAGGGWETAWVPGITHTSAYLVGQSLSALDPIDGAGSVLLEATAIGDGSQRRNLLARDFSTVGLVDSTGVFVVSFDFRIDDKPDNGSFVTFGLDDKAGGGINARNLAQGTNSALAIRIKDDLTVEYWTAGSSARVPDLTLTEGTVYHATFTVNQLQARYSFSIFQGTTNLTMISNVPFGVAKTTNEILFGTAVDGLPETTLNNPVVTAWTIDNVVISAPES